MLKVKFIFNPLPIASTETRLVIKKYKFKNYNIKIYEGKM